MNNDALAAKDKVEPLADYFTEFGQRLISYQNPDGGLPQTFPGDISGCWTSAELYMGLCLHPRGCELSSAFIESLEAYLLKVLQRHRGIGLPYYERFAPGNPKFPTSLPVIDATAAFLTGWRIRHPEEQSVSHQMQAWLAAGRASNQGGGYGIRPGDALPRTYSTAYALLALGQDRAMDCDLAALRSWQNPRTGAWPFRSGTADSRLGTVLALQALTQYDAIPWEQRDQAELWLLDRLDEDSFVEEDAFLVAEGYELTFTYAPRLNAMSELVQSLAFRSRMGHDPESYHHLVERLALALARYERRLRSVGRPGPDLEEDRLWHYIDFLLGHGSLLNGLGALAADVRDLFLTRIEKARTEIVRRQLARELPLPLRQEAKTIARQRILPTQMSRALSTHVEQVFLFLELCLLSSLRLFGESGRTALLNRMTQKRVGISDLYKTLKVWRSVAKQAEPGTGSVLAYRMVEQFDKVTHNPLYNQALERIKTLRNQVAHGWPLSDAALVAEYCDSWIAIVDQLPVLRDIELVILELMGHEVASGQHYYQWVEIAANEGLHVSRTELTFHNLLILPDRELKSVFAYDKREPSRLPLNLQPFMALTHCDGCGGDRIMAYANHLVNSEFTLLSGAPVQAKGVDVVLAVRCIELCGSQLEIGLSWEALLHS